MLNMTRQEHNIPTAAAMTAAMVGEAGAISISDAAIAQVAIVAKKAAVAARASVEIFEDAAVNLVSLYATRAGGAIGVLEDNQVFADGDGTGNNILAMLEGTAHAVDASGVLDHDELTQMVFGVAQEYRNNGRWLIADNVMQMISAKQTSNGNPQYQSITERPLVIDDQAPAVGTLLGYPVHNVPYANGTISFGDSMATYTFGNRQGIRSSVSEHDRFLNDEITWKFTMRFGGNQVDTAAMLTATGITSFA